MLQKYLERKIRIVVEDGTTFKGVVTEYFFPEDNDNGMESVIIRTEHGELFELFESDIEEIIIVEDL